MILVRRFQMAGPRVGGKVLPLLLLSTAVSVAGCSADVARFDFPGFSLTDKDGSTASIPRPSAPMRSGGTSLIEGADQGPSSGGTYIPPRSSSGSDVKVAALPEPVGVAPVAAASPPPASKASSAPLAPPAASASVPGEQIEVRQGDTLYGLSKRHGVSVSELMSVNGLTGPNLKPGQKLHLPQGRTARKMVPKTPAADFVSNAAPTSPARVATTAPARPAANWDGTYTVKPGDSLYKVSRQYGVPLNELQQVNAIADARKVRPGTVLKVPASGNGEGTGSSARVAAAPAASAPAQAEAVEPAPRVVPSTTQPTIINANKKVAAVNDTLSDAAPDAVAKPSAPKGDQVAAAGGSAVSAGSKLRWPVRGKVLSTFGPRPDGTHNDGVNLSVPEGTEVHAADGGTVAYAGSELKGYGNLILLRHDNGWVTAYAHNSELLVKRGDRVKRGQVVARAGNSGQVDQPQLHFELRQGSKPVDPTPFMDKM